MTIEIADRLHCVWSYAKITAVTDKAVRIGRDSSYAVTATADCQVWMPKSALRWVGNANCSASDNFPDVYEVEHWMLRRMTNRQFFQVWPHVNQYDIKSNWRN